MMNCDKCGRHAMTAGAVISDSFGRYCADCRSELYRQASPASASYTKDRDREDYARDLIQPYDIHGNPNQEFIRSYPEQAKKNFNDKELAEYG